MAWDGKESERNKKREAVDIASILNKIDSLVSVADQEEEKKTPLSFDREELKREGYVDAQIQEIETGQAQGLPVEVYADKEYNWMQMQELRLGLLQGVDTEFYRNRMFAANQMKEIRLGLVNHLDVSSYAKLVLAATDMRNIRKILYAKAYRENPRQFGRAILDEETGILIRIDSDSMQAFVMLPKELPVPLTKWRLTNLIQERGISYGLLDDVLWDIVENKPSDREICIAKGKPPICGESGKYELMFENSIEKRQFIAPDEEVDYSSVNTVVVVEAGEVLVKYHPAQKDVGGMTVTEIPVEGTEGKELPVLKGHGIRYDPEHLIYIATEKGHPSYNSTTGALNVWNVYHVQGDVAYYKSVEYDGTIHISGNVLNTATVRAKGDIIIDGFVEGANVYSEKDIVIKGGVNSGGRGMISAAGFLRGKFFENAVLSAGGDIEGNYFLNCKIVTDGRVVALGKKARIMGGNISAMVSVEAVIIGNYLGSRMSLEIGNVAELEKRIILLSKEGKKHGDELQLLEEGRKKLLSVLGEAAVRSNPLYEKTLAAIHTKQLQSEEVERETERLRTIARRADNAYLKAYRELQEGVMVTVNGNRKRIEQTIRGGIVLTKEKLSGREKGDEKIHIGGR